jgi:hypothetical protein
MRPQVVPAAAAKWSSRTAGLSITAHLTRRFARDERGSVSAAYVLWTGFFVTLFSVMADVTFLFMSNSEMWHVAHDAARRLSLGDMTATQTEDFVRSALANMADGSVEVMAYQSADAVEVAIAVPYDAVTVFGIYDALDSGALSARVIMRDEVAAITLIEGGLAQAAGSGAFGDG